MPDFGPSVGWSVPYLRRCLINGRPYRIGTTGWLLPWAAPGVVPARLQLESGATVVQYRWIGGRCPLSLGARDAVTVAIAADTDEDYQDLMRALQDGPMAIWPEIPSIDRWYIPGREPGQVNWATSRRLAFGRDGVSQASHPPVVLIDGVEQTVITSGSPSTGEVLVPDSTGYALLETPSDITGSYLELRYHPEFEMIADSRFAPAGYNDLGVSVTLLEHLGGVYE